MLKTGTGSLKNVSNRKYTNKETKDETNVRPKHGSYIKYPINQITKVDKSFSVQNVCDICDSGDCATTTCIECQQHLCSTCTLRHRNMRSSVSHHLIGHTSEYDSKQSVVLCLKHPKQETSLLCLKCSEEICLFCKLNHHMDHATKDFFDTTDQKSITESRSPDEIVEKISYQKSQRETSPNIMLTVQHIPEQSLVNASRSSDILIHSTETGQNIKYLRRDIRDVDCESNGDTLSVDSGCITCSHICNKFF